MDNFGFSFLGLHFRITKFTMAELYIPVILGTTRNENESQKVARFLFHKLKQLEDVKTEILDIGVANFPMLTERVSESNVISESLQVWTEKIKAADGLIIVSPEYKSGYPGSLKNFLDYLPPGVFRYKPVGISTVSSGVYAGTSCLSQLRQVVIAMAGLVIPDRFQIGNVQTAFDESLNLSDDRNIKIADKFIRELIKYTSTFQSL